MMKLLSFIALIGSIAVAYIIIKREVKDKNCQCSNETEQK